MQLLEEGETRSLAIALFDLGPARSLIDLDIPMAGHSDDPVSVADPLLRIQDMVTHTSAEGKVFGAKQAITVEEALHAWTLGGAFAGFEGFPIGGSVSLIFLLHSRS